MTRKREETAPTRNDAAVPSRSPDLDEWRDFFARSLIGCGGPRATKVCPKPCVPPPPLSQPALALRPLPPRPLPLPMESMTQAAGAALTVLVATLLAYYVVQWRRTTAGQTSSGRPRATLPRIAVPLPDAAAAGWKGAAFTKDGSLEVWPLTRACLHAARFAPDVLCAVLLGPQMPGHPRKIQCYDPATGQLLGTAPALGADDVRRIVAAARRAQVCPALELPGPPMRTKLAHRTLLWPKPAGVGGDVLQRPHRRAQRAPQLYPRPPRRHCARRRPRFRQDPYVERDEA